MLTKHREALDTLAASLLKYETLSGDEVGAVLRGDDLEEFKAAQDRHRESAEREAQRLEAEKEAKRAQEAKDKAVTESQSSDEKPDVGLSGA